jgi:hypothetical protein
MSGVQDDEVVQAVSADRPDEPLGVWILPGTSRRRQYVFNAQRGDAPPDLVAVNPIPVADQIPGRIPRGECLDAPAGEPIASRRLRLIIYVLPKERFLEAVHGDAPSPSGLRFVRRYVE